MKILDNTKNMVMVGLVPLCSFFVSCGSMVTKPIQDLGMLQGKKIVRIEREMPKFVAHTPNQSGWMALGAVGQQIANSKVQKTGKEILTQNRIGDPANQIGRELVSALQQRRSTKFSGVRNVQGEKVEEIVAASRGADYALDVKTFIWSLNHQGLEWGKYEMSYAVKMRLIDCRTGEIIAKGISSWSSEKATPWDELIEGNNASLLKKQLRRATREATEHFRTNILKL